MADEQTGQQAEQTSDHTDHGTGASAGAGQNAGTTEESKQFTQAQLDAIVKDRLDRQKRAIDSEAQKAKDTAEAQRLKEQGAFEKLAQQASERVAALEPQLTVITSERDYWRTQVQAQMDADIAAWPDEVKALLPEGDDVMARHTAYVRTKPLAGKLASLSGGTGTTPDTGGTGKQPGGGNPHNPPPARRVAGAEADRDARDAHSRHMQRSF